MKKYALYPGCVIPTEQYAYELSIREIFPLLDIKLIDLKNFSCCGEPMKSVNQMLTISLSARNIAIAEAENLDIFAPCPMCHLAMSECKRILDSDEKTKERINSFLADENLKYEGKSQIVSIIDVLYDTVGLQKISDLVKKPLNRCKSSSTLWLSSYTT